VGKFDAVAEGSAGYENGIPKAHRANLHGQVNGDCGGHFVEKNSMNTPLQTMIYKPDSKHECGDRYSRLFERSYSFDLPCLGPGLARASPSTCPSRGANVIPQSDASVGAISAGVAWP
jgi:hypothetical protein